MSSNPHPMELSIQGASKRYSRDVWGLRDFSLTIGPGVFALLGPNGAGKTTLMNILATITKPTQGMITWQGVDIVQHPNHVRAGLGYLPQHFGVYPNLNPVEFLEYLAAIKGMTGQKARQRIDELLELVNLADARGRPLGGFSGGMRQRVGIAQALLNDPQLLIVDEPTAGLDPEERVRFRNLLGDLAGERIVLLSTHIVSDVEAAATRIALISRGRLLQAASPEDLLRSVEGQVWRFVVPSQDMVNVRKQHLVSSMVRHPDGVHVRVVASRQPAPGAIPQEPTLEDAYLHLMSAADQVTSPSPEIA
jgi:ABC-2 type transport system ATP-binding protein